MGAIHGEVASADRPVRGGRKIRVGAKITSRLDGSRRASPSAGAPTRVSTRHGLPSGPVRAPPWQTAQFLLREPSVEIGCTPGHALSLDMVRNIMRTVLALLTAGALLATLAVAQAPDSQVPSRTFYLNPNSSTADMTAMETMVR